MSSIFLFTVGDALCYISLLGTTNNTVSVPTTRERIALSLRVELTFSSPMRAMAATGSTLIFSLRSFRDLTSSLLQCRDVHDLVRSRQIRFRRRPRPEGARPPPQRSRPSSTTPRCEGSLGHSTHEEMFKAPPRVLPALDRLQLDPSRVEGELRRLLVGLVCRCA